MFKNGEDVRKLSLFAVGATRMVMDRFYDQFFEPTPRKVDSLDPLAVNPGGPARASIEVSFVDG